MFKESYLQKKKKMLDILVHFSSKCLELKCSYQWQISQSLNQTCYSQNA